MHKILTLLFFSLSSYVYAADIPLDKNLNRIDFQISAKQWVSTQTAKLTVTLNATLSNADLVKARQDIMEKLSKIAPGEWHLTQFDRSQDGSGLEKLNVLAEARVQQASLTHIYQNAKSVSKPGETYQIGNIEFKPSFDEIQQARTQLREQLYLQVRNELDRMNKVYSGQQFSLNNLIFVDGNDPTPPQPQARNQMANVMLASGDSTQELAVGNELIMTAIAQAAANRLEPLNKN